MTTRLPKFCCPLWSIALLAIALAGCTGTLPASEVGTPKENTLPPKIASLFQQTKTVCFGRFMIDLPQSAKLVWGPMEVPYEMEVYPGEGPTIEADIKAKVDEITSKKHNFEPSMLIGVFDSINPDSKIVVKYYSPLNAVFVELYSYIRLGNTAFVQWIPRSGQGKDDENGKRFVDKTAYKKRVAYLLSIARRLRLRDENEIPEEHGVCIEEGFLAVPLDDRSERIAIGFRFPELPDATFAVETRNTDRPTDDDTLKAARRAGREAASDSGELALFNSIQTLRERNRAIGEWKGAEALLRLPSNRKRKVEESHEFVFISPGAAEDLLRPYARIMMYTGVKDNTRGRVPPSLTDDEAIALWDKLTSTIRVRPVN